MRTSKYRALSAFEFLLGAFVVIGHNVFRILPNEVPICLGDFVIEPLTGKFWPAPVAPAMANEIAGNPKVAALALLIVWIFAAFGEEISYRGYLIRRGADVGSRSTAANWIAMLLVSILFGYGHYYKGTSGVID